ncbi:hypothetical protein Ciccas_011530 [Cichlidogyrus casuarinus]|uniref:Uncharacterized protein n=1 Tax=Cichlidogyrus casuarinus TaxID=1844966 RepID=A0ABD2PR02_9PLAT
MSLEQSPELVRIDDDDDDDEEEQEENPVVFAPDSLLVSAEIKLVPPIPASTNSEAPSEASEGSPPTPAPSTNELKTD